jgi:endonuclease YncB( thermonuclease family)
VGVCEMGGQDVGVVLVRNRYARDCPRFSRRRYAPLERAAKADGFNLSSVYRLPSYCRPR